MFKAGGSTPPRSINLTPRRKLITIGRAHPQAEAERTGFLGPPSFSLSHPKKAREKMTWYNCRIECRKFGKTRKEQQRYRCCQCYKTYSEPGNEHTERSGAPRRWKHGSWTMSGESSSYLIRRTNKWKLTGTRISRRRVLLWTK